MRVAYRKFGGFFKSWDNLLQEAATFASTLSPESLITISQSADQMSGLVTVWFWTNEERSAERRKAYAKAT